MFTPLRKIAGIDQIFNMLFVLFIHHPEICLIPQIAQCTLGSAEHIMANDEGIRMSQFEENCDMLLQRFLNVIIEIYVYFN